MRLVLRKEQVLREGGVLVDPCSRLLDIAAAYFVFRFGRTLQILKRKRYGSRCEPGIGKIPTGWMDTLLISRRN